MGIHFHTAPNVHARRFDDELVLLHLGAGMYYSLDPVGATIWETLSEGRSTDEAVAAVVAGYDVDEPTARADAQKLVEELLAKGLIESRST